MRNITRIYLIFALAMITLAPLPSQSRVFLDEYYERAQYNIYPEGVVNFGQDIVISISDSVGNISILIVDQERGFEVSIFLSEDTLYKVRPERSIRFIMFLTPSSDFKGEIKIYSEGTAVSSFIQLGVAAFLTLLAIGVEFFLRKRTTSTYLIDEDTRLNVRGLVIGMIPFYLSPPYLSVSMFDFNDGQPIYLPDIHFYSIYSETTRFHVVLLIILLIMLTHRLTITSSTPMYSVLPIDTKRQYLARVTLYLSVLFVLVTFTYGTALSNGEYSGKQYVSIYLLAFVVGLVTLSLFVLLQIFLVDMVRIRFITPYIFPASLLVYTFLFKEKGVPPYNLLFLENISIKDSPFPLLWYYFLEVIFGITILVFLDLRLRRSRGFIAN